MSAMKPSGYMSDAAFDEEGLGYKGIVEVESDYLHHFAIRRILAPWIRLTFRFT